MRRLKTPLLPLAVLCLAAWSGLAEPKDPPLELRDLVNRARALANGQTAGDALPEADQNPSLTEDFSGSSCEVVPTSLEFGSVVVGSSSDLAFRIINNGGTTLSGTVSESCSQYWIVLGGGPYSIAPGDTHEVAVRFEPTSIGTHTCIINTGDTSCYDVHCVGDTGIRTNSSGKWALHYAGKHDPTANNCGLQLETCEDVVVDAPSGPGRYDIYVMAVDVDEVAGLRFGLSCDGPPPFFYGWTKCSFLEIPTSGWPGCAEGNAMVWSSGQPGPHVTVGILDTYVYGASSLSTGPDPRVGFAEWCDGSEPSPVCCSTARPGAFSTVGFGLPGSITCGPESCFVPTPLSPADGSGCAATTVTLDWEDVLGALGYEVQVGTSCGAGSTYSAMSSAKIVTDLTPDTDYYWRVRAECEEDWGSWSACRSFTTSPAPPGVPALASPSDGSTCMPAAVAFEWGDVPGALEYEIQLGASCGDGPVYVTAGSDTTLTGLALGTVHRWRVRAKGDCGAFGGWSDCWSFTTVPLLAAPAQTSPSNGATCVARPVALAWGEVSGALKYEVQIGAGCGSGTVYETNEENLTLTGLASGTQYFWKVRAGGDCGIWSGWSSCKGFTTVPGSPGVPVLTSPPDGATDKPTTVSLAWNCVADAVEYEMQIGTSCGSGAKYRTGSCSKSVSGLLTNTEYEWRVRAKNTCDTWGGWSSCRSFRTAPPDLSKNKNGKWALHYAGPHDSKANTCDFQMTDCDVVADAPSTPGTYDVYVIAVDVQEIAGHRFGLSCEGPFFFEAWQTCADFEIPAPGWPGCGEGNAMVWSAVQPGPYVTLGILQVYAYGTSRLSTGPDPRVGFAEWCDRSQPTPICYKTTSSQAFGSVGFGVPGYNPCDGLIPVELAGFEARATGDGILLEWTSTGASRFSYFYVHRSTNEADEDYVRLHNDPIEGAGLESREYSFKDTDVISGTVYYYKIEAVEPGEGSIFFGPYAVMAGAKRAEYRLSQNVPNPFSRGGRTTIHYSVAEAGRVTVRILDVAGRLVRTIVDEAESGDNLITWDGTGQNGRRLASGVYFYEIEAGRFSAERKMLLIE